MEKSVAPADKGEFKHLIEFEINRLDGIISSLQSNISQIEIAIIGAILAVVLSLNIYIKNKSDLIVILISMFFFVAIILFIYSNYLFIISIIAPKVPEKQIVKNVPYGEVLEKDMFDRKAYVSNMFGSSQYFFLTQHIFFGISMIAPFIWPYLKLSIWDMSILWVVYFSIFDILSLIFISLCNKEKKWTDIIFLKNIDLSNPKNLKIKATLLFLTLIILAIFFVILYLYFAYILTMRYIIYNINYLNIFVTQTPFVFIITLLITLYLISSVPRYVTFKYKSQILDLKQQKYREIRRQLYESENPDLETLFSEYEFNAPW
jgi:hypothetical protein